MLLIRDTMVSYNARGCDEIMCQFIKDLDMSHDFSTAKVCDVEEIQPNNHSNDNDETIM